MPVHRTTKDGKPAYSGKAYTYTSGDKASKAKATASRE